MMHYKSKQKKKGRKFVEASDGKPGKAVESKPKREKTEKGGTGYEKT